MKIVDCGYYIFYVDETTNQVIDLPFELKIKMIKEKEDVIYSIRSEFENQITYINQIEQKTEQTPDDNFTEQFNTFNTFSQTIKHTILESFEYISSFFDEISNSTNKSYYNFMMN